MRRLPSNRLPALHNCRALGVNVVERFRLLELFQIVPERSSRQKARRNQRERPLLDSHLDLRWIDIPARSLQKFAHLILELPKQHQRDPCGSNLCTVHPVAERETQ